MFSGREQERGETYLLQPKESLLLLLQLVLQLGLLRVHRLPTLARYQLLVYSTRPAPAHAAVFEGLEPLQQRLVLALQPVHRRPAQVLPLLRGVVAHRQDPDTRRQVAARANLAPELEQLLFEVVDLLELLLRICFRLPEP